jgi:hypothetical protein
MIRSTQQLKEPSIEEGLAFTWTSFCFMKLVKCIGGVGILPPILVHDIRV